MKEVKTTRRLKRKLQPYMPDRTVILYNLPPLRMCSSRLSQIVKLSNYRMLRKVTACNNF